MTEWREVTLRDVCELERGYDLPAAARRIGAVPIVSSSGVTGFHDVAKVPGPGVVTGRYGTLGQVFYVSEDFWPLNTALYVRDFKGNDPRFVASLLESLELGGNDGAAAVPGVNRNQLHKLPTRLPSVQTQAKVGTILSCLTDSIENNRRRIEVLEQMAQAIYREWFVHFRYPGHENVPPVDSPLGPIPQDWKVKPLASVASLVRTTVHPKRSSDEIFHHYSIPAFDNGRTPSMDDGASIKSGKFLVAKPSVLVSKLNPRTKRVWLVEPSRDSRSVASTEFLVLRPSDGGSLDFLYLLAGSPSFQERLRELSGGTSTSHQRAKPDDFLNMSTVVPRSPLPDELTRVTGAQLRMAEVLRDQSRRLVAVRELLLPKLVTGEIDVSTLDLGALVDSVA